MVQSMLMSKWLPEARALHQVFSVRSYLIAYPFMALGVGLFYALLLVGLPLGTFALWVLQFLKPSELVFAVAMGLLLPLIVLLNIFLWRNPCCSVRETHRTNGRLIAVILGIIPNALCCTPIIPTVVALFASGVTIIAISAPIQFFLNTYAWTIYSLAIVGVWLSLRTASLRFIPPQ